MAINLKVGSFGKLIYNNTSKRLVIACENNTYSCASGCCQIYAMHAIEGVGGVTTFTTDGATTSGLILGTAAVFACPIQTDTNGGTGIFWNGGNFEWISPTPTFTGNTDAYNSIIPPPRCPPTDADSNASSFWINTPQTESFPTSVRCCTSVPPSPATTSTIVTSNLIGTINSTNTTPTPSFPIWGGTFVWSVAFGVWIPAEVFPFGGSIAIQASNGDYIDDVSAAVDFGEFTAGGSPTGCLLNRLSLSGGLSIEFWRVGGSSRIGTLDLHTMETVLGSRMYIGLGF